MPDAAATGFIFDGVDWQAVAHGSNKCDEWVREVLGDMTYEICCQSILLRQGAHDKFLSAKPTERQLVLNTLLDFEPYRRRQAGARGRKGTARGEADLLQARLGDLVPDDPDTLARLGARDTCGFDNESICDAARSAARSKASPGSLTDTPLDIGVPATGPAACWITSATSCAITRCPAAECGLCAPERKNMSEPLVKATAATRSVSRSAVLSAWTRTFDRSMSSAGSKLLRMPASRGRPAPRAR